MAGGAKLKILPQVSGSGYYSYSPVLRQYGTEQSIQAVIDVCKQRVWNKEVAEVGVGDISFENGGPMPPHVSHTDGTCVDIRPFRKDKKYAPVTIQDGDYDREATRSLVAVLRAHKNVKKVLFNDSQIQGVTSWPGHDNHLHVIMQK